MKIFYFLLLVLPFLIYCENPILIFRKPFAFLKRNKGNNSSKVDQIKNKQIEEDPFEKAHEYCSWFTWCPQNKTCYFDRCYFDNEVKDIKKDKWTPDGSRCSFFHFAFCVNGFHCEKRRCVKDEGTFSIETSQFNNTNPQARLNFAKETNKEMNANKNNLKSENQLPNILAMEIESNNENLISYRKHNLK